MKKTLSILLISGLLSGCASMGDLRDTREEANQKANSTLELMQRHIDIEQKYVQETSKFTQDLLNYIKDLETRIKELEKQNKKKAKKK